MVARKGTGGRLRLTVSVILMVTGLGWYGMAVLAYNDSTASNSSAVPWLLGAPSTG